MFVILATRTEASNQSATASYIALSKCFQTQSINTLQVENQSSLLLIVTTWAVITQKAPSLLRSLWCTIFPFRCFNSRLLVFLVISQLRMRLEQKILKMKKEKKNLRNERRKGERKLKQDWERWCKTRKKGKKNHRNTIVVKVTVALLLS